MSNQQNRRSNMAPLRLDERLTLARLAIDFFSPFQYQQKAKVIGKSPSTTSIEPFTGLDFMLYLKSLGHVYDDGRGLVGLTDLLRRLESADVLSNMGKRAGGVYLSDAYYFMRQLSSRQRGGLLWMARALGPEFVYCAFDQVTMQLTGTANDDQVAGTAFAIAPNWLLTCAHVVDDMTIDKVQSFGGSTFNVTRTIAHPIIDVGLVQVAQPFPMLPGLALREPIVGETVYTIGYPRVPMSREPALIMQRGEVTMPGMTLLHGQRVFLYSAIARPGNSGGPIVADSGHVVGIVTQELTEETERFRMPYHAGVGMEELRRAVAEMEPSIELPIEDFT